MDNNKTSDICYIAEFVQNFLDLNQGALSISQYKQFWTQLGGSGTNTEQFCSNYLAVLLVRLLALETGLDKDRQFSLMELVKKIILNQELNPSDIANKVTSIALTSSDDIPPGKSSLSGYILLLLVLFFLAQAA